MRKHFEMKLSSGNITKGMNIWAVHLVSSSEPFLKSTKIEHREMDLRIRKLMTRQEIRCPTNDIDYKHHENEIKDSVDASILGLKYYIKRS